NVTATTVRGPGSRSRKFECVRRQAPIPQGRHILFSPRRQTHFDEPSEVYITRGSRSWNSNAGRRCKRRHGSGWGSCDARNSACDAAVRTASKAEKLKPDLSRWSYSKDADRLRDVLGLDVGSDGRAALSASVSVGCRRYVVDQ